MITKEKIIEILHSHSYNTEDQAGSHLIVVDDDSWDEVANEILKNNGVLGDVSQQRELLEALKGVERECDNQNPTHENIWRIANGAIKGSNCG